MKILIKNALIADQRSLFNGQIKDLFILDGIINAIGDNLTTPADKIVDTPNVVVSQGWVDVFAHFNEPGYEHRETIDSGIEAGIAGGFTHLFLVPNTQPVVQNKSIIDFIKRKSVGKGVNLLPIGAATKDIEGKDLAEMWEMQQAGAIAFSDGLNSIQSAGLMLKALQYIKAFDSTFIQMPIDKSIGTHGLINEGIVSTQLGLPGLPAIAEHIIIKRDIDLLKYADSKLHITAVSTAESLELIKEAKAQGLKISCSVTPYHLFFSDEDLMDYDTHLKVNPPLRTKKDVEALRKGIVDGTIDCIASHHFPQHWDNKSCEFEYAKNGMISLQTVFNVLMTAIPDITPAKVAELLSENARNLFNIASSGIEIGAKADITLFTNTGNTIFTKDSNKSKSQNSPFFNKTLQGKVVGTIYNNSVNITT